MSIWIWRVVTGVWMALIFILSSSLFASQVSYDGTLDLFGALNYAVRKLAHSIEFGILSYLWFRSLCSQPDRFRSSLIWSLVISLVYAVTDEWHQTFVPERSGKATDVLFDAVGAAAVVLRLWNVRQRGAVSHQERSSRPPGKAEIR